MQNKLVSILINNYNYAQFLGQAIESALNQTYKNVEVIVVDDGSMDNSREIISSFSDRIKAIYKKNGGQASAFNTGFAASNGEFIFLLDADDLFDIQKIEKSIRFFECNDEIGWIFHRIKYVDSQLNEMDKLNVYNQCMCEFDLVDVRETLKKGNKFEFILPATSGLGFKRQTLKSILPMPENIKITSDNYVKFAALSLSKGILLHKYLAFQRIHQSNLFTFRDDVQTKASEIGLMTGYYLREQFPTIALFADKVFARGLGELIAVVGWKKTFAIPEASQYLQRFWSVPDRFKYLPRVGFHFLRSQLAKLKNK